MDLPADPIAFVGPILIGNMLTWLLYGVLLVQTVQYYQSFGSSDCIGFRTIVGVVLVLQTLGLVLITHYGWHMMVLGYLHPVNILIPPRTAFLPPIVNGLVTLCVQAFFAWKIQSLGQKSIIIMAVAILICLLSLVQLGSSIGVAVQFLSIDQLQVLQLNRLKLPVSIHLVSTASCDTVITLSMITILSRFKQKTNFVKTKSILNSLILHTIENGMITTIVAITNLILYFKRNTKDTSNLACQEIIGGLYATVLLTTLNRRQMRPPGVEGSGSIHLTNVADFGCSPGMRDTASRPGHFQVNMIREVDSQVSSNNMEMGDKDKSPQRSMIISVSTEVQRQSFGGKLGELGGRLAELDRETARYS